MRGDRVWVRGEQEGSGVGGVPCMRPWGHGGRGPWGPGQPRVGDCFGSRDMGPWDLGAMGP